MACDPDGADSTMLEAAATAACVNCTTACINPVARIFGSNAMGKEVVDAMRQAEREAGLRPSLESEVARLTKLVHILWKEVERLEGIIRVTPDGLQIKSGRSEILVLKNGGIILNGLRISLETPGKNDLFY